MLLTVRFAHLENTPSVKVGAAVKRGQLLGIVGSSGQSEARHLHIDLASGRVDYLFQLANYDNGSPPPGPLRQLLLFVDAELFGGVAPVVTTPYAEVDYFVKRGKVHYGLDLVPENRHDQKAKMELFWNRSADGEVLAVIDDLKGYGHCLYVGFEV